MGFAFRPCRGSESCRIAAARPHPLARENKEGGRLARGAGARGTCVCRLSPYAAGSDRTDESQTDRRERPRGESNRLSVVSSRMRDPQPFKPFAARPSERPDRTQATTDTGNVSRTGQGPLGPGRARRLAPTRVPDLARSFPRPCAAGAVDVMVLGPCLLRKPTGRVEPASGVKCVLERAVVSPAGACAGRGADTAHREPHACKSAGGATKTPRAGGMSNSAPARGIAVPRRAVAMSHRGRERAPSMIA